MQSLIYISRGKALALQTYSVAVVLHLFPVFQVHGPDVAIEQAGWVRDRVCPCTAEKKRSVWGCCVIKGCAVVSSS